MLFMYKLGPVLLSCHKLVLLDLMFVLSSGILLRGFHPMLALVYLLISFSLFLPSVPISPVYYYSSYVSVPTIECGLCVSTSSLVFVFLVPSFFVTPLTVLISVISLRQLEFYFFDLCQHPWFANKYQNLPIDCFEDIYLYFSWNFLFIYKTLFMTW